MNIFVLDLNPWTAASYHCDKHVVKMTLETAQLLSTTHHALKSPLASEMYKPTHINHPCAIWVRESLDNYSWTLDLFRALSHEYTDRYGKIHLSVRKYLELFCEPPPNLLAKGLTPFARCFSGRKYDMDIVSSYRQFYKDDKASFAVWKNGNIPYWWNNP